MMPNTEDAGPFVINDEKPAGEILANFRVPVEPNGRLRMSDVTMDAWRAWFLQFRVYRAYRGVPRVAVPCRIEAIVRRCVCGVQNPVTDRTIAYWTSGIREAAIRSGLVGAADLKGVTVAFRSVEGVPTSERPHVDGTQIIILAA